MLEGDRADEFSVESDFDQGGLRGVAEKQMPVARADGEVASAIGRDIGCGEFAFDTAIGAIDDAKGVAGGQSQEEMVGVGIVSEAEEDVFGFEIRGDIAGFDAGGSLVADRVELIRAEDVEVIRPQCGTTDSAQGEGN